MIRYPIFNTSVQICSDDMDIILCIITEPHNDTLSNFFLLNQ